MSEEFTIEHLLQGVSRLPAAPRILPKLQGLLRDPNSSLEDITRLLKLDPAMAAQIVRLSNSAFYGAANPAKEIGEAVNRVGFNEVFKLVGVVATQKLLGGSLSLYNMDSGQLWHRSIASGTLMASLSHLTHISADTAYTVGLLHGLGKIVIDTYYTEHKIEHNMAGLRSVTVEEELYALGFTNAQVAGALLNRWNFMPEIAIPIEYYLRPTYAPGEHLKTALLLALSLEVLDRFHEDADTAHNTFDPDPDFLAELALTQHDLVNAAERALRTTDALIASLGI